MQGTLHGVTVGLSGMNPLDWTIALVLAISTVTAFMRGLIRSLVSLLGVVVGIALACWYTPAVAVWLQRWIRQLALAEIVAFVLILSIAYALSAILGRLLRGACSAVGLGFLDRMGGALFGLLRAVLLLAALLLPLAPLMGRISAVKTSVLIPYLLPASHGISFVLPRDFGKRIAASDLWNHLPSRSRDEVYAH